MIPFTDLIHRFIELDKKKAEYKKFLEEYKACVTELVDTHGIGASFQDADGTVYKTATQEGRFVYFEPFTVVRTRREGETKGSLSLKEARELGFEVEANK